MNAGTDAESGNSVFVDGSNAGYRFDGAEWTRFTGTGNQTAGAGLTITGSVLNVIGDSSMTITDDEIGVKVGNGLEVDETNGVQITDAFIASLLGLEWWYSDWCFGSACCSYRRHGSCKQKVR